MYFIHTLALYMFSKSCEYGIRASIYIAKQSLKGRIVGQVEIAESTDSPVAFTAKILQKLTKNTLINSIKGPNGGFFIENHDLDNMKLLDIVLAIDGNNVVQKCGLGLENCNALKPCPLHFSFVNIRSEIREMLKSTSLRTLAEEVSEGTSFLKR